MQREPGGNSPFLHFSQESHSGFVTLTGRKFTSDSGKRLVYEKSPLPRLRDIALAAAVLTAVTLPGLLFKGLSFPETNIVVVCIFSVLLIARFTAGYLCGISASILSLLLFNCFFPEPCFTPDVHDPTYLIACFIMISTTHVTGALTTKAREANRRRSSKRV